MVSQQRNMGGTSLRNLEDLHERLKLKRYRAQPMRRVFIEKDDGSQRPLSIPVIRDKVVKRATVEVLNRIYVHVCRVDQRISTVLL